MLNCILVTILEPKRIVVQLKGVVNEESKLISLGFSKKGDCYNVDFEDEKKSFF